MMEIADFPRKLGFLNSEKARYKVVYGGRGGGKSWGFARALLLHGVNRPLRILCTREVQRSIKDSVHKLLGDQIQMLGLGKFYEVLESEIRGRNGTEFIFSGLHDQTVESIKSFEGVDICWIEEGQVITNRSWNILTPTIRKDDSEIWISMNPELESDPTYERFIKNPPEGAIVVKMNWRDNPWFNEILNQERLHDKKTYPQEYNNKWEGECKPAVEGAIWFEEVSKMEQEHRIRNVPYDPMLKAHVVWDLGFNDAMAISIIQKMTSEIRIIRYIEDSHRTLDSYSAELKELRYNWGKVWLPAADGFSKDYKTGKGADEILTTLGWNVAKKHEVADVGVEEGIRQTRLVFPRFYIDESNCERLIQCWKRYRRHVNRTTAEAGAPMHDTFSHGGDNTRYIAINADSMRNDTDNVRRPAFVASYQPLDRAVGY